MRGRLGLVSEGLASRLFLANVPGLAEELGPVMASSRRLASRLVNLIRAGHPVGNYDAFRRSRTVLLCAPEASVAQLASRMAAANIHWKGKVVLLCDSRLDSTELGALEERGAAIGSLGPINGFEGLGCVVEGHRAAVREARRLLKNGSNRVQEIQTSNKTCYLAGLSLGTSLLTPLLDASVHCLREAGFKPGPAADIAERMFQKTLRAYLHGGKNARGLRLAPEDCAAIERQIQVLRRTNPALASYVSLAAALALQLLPEPSPAAIGRSPNQNPSAAKLRCQP